MTKSPNPHSSMTRRRGLGTGRLIQMCSVFAGLCCVKMRKPPVTTISAERRCFRLFRGLLLAFLRFIL